MQKFLQTIDRVNTWIGQLFGWFVLALTLFVTFEVFSRYALGNPHAWSFDAMNMMYGALFMMAGAYTLSKNGHVRGDVLRSEEHTSELQSLMRISYAVFCLKKTTNATKPNNNQLH